MSALLALCLAAVAYDGDGPIRCQGQSVKLRLEAINAPDFTSAPPCRPGDPRRATAWCDDVLAARARDGLNRILRSGTVTYRLTGKRSWDRHIAKVYVDGRDVECAMVAAGLARVRWGELVC